MSVSEWLEANLELGIKVWMILKSRLQYLVWCGVLALPERREAHDQYIQFPVSVECHDSIGPTRGWAADTLVKTVLSASASASSGLRDSDSLDFLGRELCESRGTTE